MYEVLQRINDVAQVGSYNGVTLGIKGLDTLVDTLDGLTLPLLVALPRGTSLWEYSDGSRHTVTLQFDLRFYLAKQGERNKALNLIEAYKYSDLASEVFLSRPQLELATASPKRLPMIAGNLEWQITSNLTSPLEWPIGVSESRGGVLYWGFIARLSIPCRKLIKPKIQG